MKLSINVARCNGCRDCQVVCKDEHCDNDWRPYSAPQPDTGQFWMMVEEEVRGQVPVVKMTYTPTLCAHCDDAPCAKACASGAFKRREEGLLILEPDTCTGCGACVEACPIKAIFFNAELNIAQKCNGCAHLLDNGWDVPRCVDVCPHDAIQWVADDDDLIATGQPLPALADCGARVVYQNVPKRFIAGCAVDFEADEVIIGAKVTAVSAEATIEVETDEFGDFIFNDVEPAAYTVTISAEGYQQFTCQADVTEIDLTLGDLSVIK